MKKIIPALLLSIFVSHAAVVYTQPPAAGTNGFLSSTDLNGGSNLEQFIWDTFSVTTNYQATIPTQTGSGFFRLYHP